VLDLIWAVVFLAAPVAALVITRSAALTALLMAAAFGVSGVLLQFVGTTISPLALGPLQAWVAATLLVVVVAAVLLRGAGGPRLDRTGLLVVCGTSALMAVVFLLARLAAPGSPGALTSVGYLVQRTGAEDNAKWLNATAHLADGTAVDSWSNVGGPLVLVLVVTATLISVASTALLGGVNEVAVAGGALVLAEFLMVVVSPFALAVVVQMRRRWIPGSAPGRLPWPFTLLGVVLLSSGVAVLLVLGHITLQYTILVLTLWVSVFLVGFRTAHARLLATVAVICTAEVWFPINVIAAGLIVALIGFGAYGLARRSSPLRSGVTLAAGLVLGVLMFDFLRSSIGYALGVGDTASAAATTGGAARGIVALAVPSLPLFGSPGGTEEVTIILGLLAVVTVIGAVLVLRRDGTPWQTVLPFSPIIILVTYAVLVTLADFWAVGDGPGYGAKKMAFAVLIPVLVSTLPVALLLVDRGRAGMTLARWISVGAVVVLLVLDTLLPRAVVQAKPALWPSAAGDPAPYWWPAEVRDVADQPLASNPIGCVYLPLGAERPTVLVNGPRAYSCTRILAGLAGQGLAADVLVQWQLTEWLQNEPMWDDFQRYFAMVPQEVRDRTVILLDEDSAVVGIETIQTLMDRYPAAEPTGS
jgi:hypothetical protein